MRFWRFAAIALGITMVYLFRVVEPLVDPAHLEVYHWSGSAMGLFLPMLLDVLIVFGAVLLALVLTQPYRRLHAVLWLAILAPMPYLVFKNMLLLFPGLGMREAPSSLLYLAGIMALVLIVGGTSYAERWNVRLVEGASASFLFGAIGGSFLLLEAVWCGVHSRGLNAPPTLLVQTSRDGEHHAAHGRVLWIIFDELSYQQVFERRVPGLNLPAFDTLAAQSTVFRHVEPAGIYTERIVPALMIGSPVHSIQSTSAGQLLVRASDRDAWSAFRAQNTIFADAVQRGYHTGIAGWFNPYCRLLPSVLEQCVWTYSGESGSDPQNPLLLNMLRPLLSAMNDDPIKHALMEWSGLPENSDVGGRRHIADYKYLAAASKKLLADPTIDFLFLHFPVPHPNGIYDRKTGRFVTHKSTYIDNLALADACLENIEKTMQDSGQWNSSTIVVMGDHGWRTSLLWKGGPEWTAEEQIASSGGLFDDRPAYLVKLPYQRNRSEVTNAFSALRTRSLLQALLQGTLTSSQDLLLWSYR